MEYTEQEVQTMQYAWSSLPTMRMGVNYYLQYSPEVVSENDTTLHEKLYWGVSYNVVTGKQECDYYGAGYALPEPYMSMLEEKAMSNNEIASQSVNVFGEDAYKLDFYVREIDPDDNVEYCYRKDRDNGYYRYVEPIDEYDEFTSLRPEYIQGLKSISNNELEGHYTTSKGVLYKATIKLWDDTRLPKEMHLYCGESMYNQGLKVDWQKVDYTFYDFDSELQMTDDIYNDAVESLPMSVSSDDMSLIGNYYLLRYFDKYTPGQEVILQNGDSYYKYSDTFYFSIPMDASARVTFTTSANMSVSTDDIVCTDASGMISPVELVDGKWQTTRVVNGEAELQFIKIENNQNTTYTYTGNYMLERVMANVDYTYPTTISQNYLAGTQLAYKGQNIVIEEQAVLPNGQTLDMTEPTHIDQTISYNKSSNGDVDIASVKFASKLAKIDGISSNDISDYLAYYRHKPQYDCEEDVLEFFNYIKPVTEYLYSIYDITTYDLEHSDSEDDYRFYGYSTDRSVCISLSMIFDNVEYQPTFYYSITQVFDSYDK